GGFRLGPAVQELRGRLGGGGAAALADAGLAAAPALAGGVQGFGQGADVPVPAGEAVAAAPVGGGQRGAQPVGGLGQADGQPVQPVGVEAGHDQDGVLPRPDG